MPKKKQPPVPKNLLQLTVMASLPLLRLGRDNSEYGGLGSAVMIQYREKFFFCTVQHNIKDPEKVLCIDTSKTNGTQLETIKVDKLSTVKSYQLPETTKEAIENILQDEATTGSYVDIAFGEIPEPFTIPQIKRIIDADGKNFVVPESIKICVPAQKGLSFDMGSAYSFYGRIKAELIDGNRIFTEEQFIIGMKLSAILDFWLKFDLGQPIADHANFEGCSGAPIFDFDGNLVALLANGDDDVSQPYIYGFRIDKLLEFIDMAYFEDENIGTTKQSS